jgi:hypothetical protein
MFNIGAVGKSGESEQGNAKRAVMAKYRSRLMGLGIAAAVAACPSIVRAQTLPATTEATESEAVGPLRIQVTAVQGGTQYRLNPDTKWQTLAAGVELPEGVEFRTGPKGTIQFTVGTDQVYRVDRLTAAKILRAALLPDGTIKTDVGMTYGRVSKDVDLATHPHQDRIISPSSTLAVRGTRVALYDQPPYEPEAISLTGAAVFQNLHGQLVQLGSKGSGPETVDGDSTSPAEYQLQNAPVDPQGRFAGRTLTEQQGLANVLNGLQGTQLGVFQGIQGQIGAGIFKDRIMSVTGVTIATGELQFIATWNSSTPLSVVDLTVVSSKDDVVNPFNLTSADGGFFLPGPNHGNIANQNNNTFGTETVEFGSTLASSTFPPGPYIINLTLTGTTTQSLAENQSITANVSLFPEQVSAQTIVNNRTQSTTTLAHSASTTLSVSNPSQTYLVTTPITANQATPVLTSANAEQLIQQALSSQISSGTAGQTVRAASRKRP